MRYMILAMEVYKDSMKKFLLLLLMLAMVFAMSFTASAREYLYGVINEVIDGDTLIVRIADVNGEISEYKCSDGILINGSEYYDKTEICDLLFSGKFIKFVSDGDYVKSIEYADGASVYTDVTYDTVKKTFEGLDADTAQLPVYYTYNGSIVKPYLDGNHRYNIEVYAYAINITDITAVDMPCTVKYTDIGDGVSSDFLRYISVMCETTSDNPIIRAKLYSGGNDLVSTAVGEYGEVTFESLPNENCDYKIRLWVENEEGTCQSYVYEYDCSTSKLSVLYGYVLESGINTSGFSNCLQLKICGTDGVSAVYDCAKLVYINGTRYRNYDEALTAVPLESYAKFALYDDQIQVISCTTEYETFADVKYNADRNFFEIDGKDVSSLPVYSISGEDFTVPYLDGNHLYDLNVYEHAVVITDMKADNMPFTVTNIEIGSAISEKFMHTIYVYGEIISDESTEGVKIKYQLYDKNMALLSEKEMEYSPEVDGGFRDLPNITASYTVKFRLENALGEAVSYTYEKKYTIEKEEILYGKILDSGLSQIGFSGDVAMLKIADFQGTEYIYSLSESTAINSVTYNDANEMLNVIKIGSYAAFSASDDIISVINFDDTPEVYENVTYNTSGEVFESLPLGAKGLPVFYTYNGEQCMAHLDSNHKYTVELYDYAVSITDMTASDTVNTIKYINIGGSIDEYFNGIISVYCETDCGDAYLHGEFYDDNMKCLGTEKVHFTGDAELVFGSFPNRYAVYTVKFQLKDENNNILSPVYVKSYAFNPISAMYGKIVAKGVSSGFSQVLMVKITDASGNSVTYDCDSKMLINGEKYNNLDDLGNAIADNSFVKYAVDSSGVITVMNINKLEHSISSFEHDGKDLGVDVYIYHNGDEEVNGSIYASVYNKHGKLKGIYKHGVKFDGPSDASVSMYIRDYVYEDGDYIKTFVWDENSSPLCEWKSDKLK